MFQTSLEGGVLKYTDSPLLRAITFGRVIIVDEADKAPEHVVAVFRSLGGHGEMTLADGRRVRPVRERDDDIVVHPNFRLVLLANRPGYRASEQSVHPDGSINCCVISSFLGQPLLASVGRQLQLVINCL